MVALDPKPPTLQQPAFSVGLLGDASRETAPAKPPRTAMPWQLCRLFRSLLKGSSKGSGSLKGMFTSLCKATYKIYGLLDFRAFEVQV